LIFWELTEEPREEVGLRLDGWNVSGDALIFAEPHRLSLEINY